MFSISPKGSRKNHRKYPGIKGRRPDFAKIRQEEAIERQEAYDKLSLEEKLSKLPAFPAAERQRQRILAKIVTRDAKKNESRAEANLEENKEKQSKNKNRNIK